MISTIGSACLNIPVVTYNIKKRSKFLLRARVRACVGACVRFLEIWISLILIILPCLRNDHGPSLSDVNVHPSMVLSLLASALSSRQPSSNARSSAWILYPVWSLVTSQAHSFELEAKSASKPRTIWWAKFSSKFSGILSPVIPFVGGPSECKHKRVATYSVRMSLKPSSWPSSNSSLSLSKLAVRNQQYPLLVILSRP